MKKVKSKKQTGRVVQRSKKTKKSNSSKGKNWSLRLGGLNGYTTHEATVSHTYRGKKVGTSFLHKSSRKDPKDDYLKHLEYFERRKELMNKKVHVLRVDKELLDLKEVV